VDFRECWQYRDLLFFLVLRDIRVKYKQTVLGGLWAIIQPFFSMVVFNLFFGRLAKMPSDGVPYPIFNYSAMVAWSYFANAVIASGNSLVGNTNLISKVYFPRVIIPLIPVFAGLLDFFIAFVMLLFMMLYFNMYPTVMTVWVPFMVFLMMLVACGVGLFLAALNVQYRDIRYAMPFLIQLWMFASPIVYPVSLIPEKYRLLYGLNPMTGVIEGFRSVLLGTVDYPADLIIMSAVVSLLMFIMGAFYFRKTERSFADVI
jgi:lipopolysaccharide transport system permease protein